MRRLILLLVVVLGLAPVWVRSPAPAETTDERPILTMTPLSVSAVELGEVEAVGAWLLDSPNRHFGSYSALLALGDDTLLAASDGGRRLRFTPPGNTGPAPAFDEFVELDFGMKHMADIEALARDPATGRIWVAYEHTGAIERYDARLRLQGRVRPRAMQGWPGNAGPEAMVRLADGRFVVLAEAGTGWFASDGPGLLFPGDPVAGARPLEFRFRPPAGFRPVDMAPLPDGRVLILLREVLWSVPPEFAGKLVMADPGTIRAGALWRWKEIADLRAPLPADNYEGLAVEQAGDGQVTLWLISDDNNATFQETLLLKLVWRPNEKARGTSRTPGCFAAIGLKRRRRPSSARA